MSSSRLIRFNGKTRNMRQWAEQYGLSAMLLKYRLDAGWSIRDAITTPPMKRRPMARIKNPMQSIKARMEADHKAFRDRLHCQLDSLIDSMRADYERKAEIALQESVKQYQRWGVAENFSEGQGTGGGRQALESAKSDFSQKGSA